MLFKSYCVSHVGIDFTFLEMVYVHWHLKRDRCLIEFVTSISIRRELVENIAGAAAAAIS